MIRIYPGDLLRITACERFYYALVFDKVSMFGGQLCFVYHRTSSEPLTANEVLDGPRDGFHQVIDFIWAKREKRVERIATKLDVAAENSAIRFLKTTFTTQGKAKEWWIRDREGNDIKRVTKLTSEEARYPLHECIDDTIMIGLVDQRWSPEKDPSI